MARLISSYELKNIKKKFDSKKIIGLCHGAFDILHNGHLDHFTEAKKKVDILVVSVTADKFIKKGPNQPFNNELNRAKFLQHINEIDYVYIDRNLTAENIILQLKPNFYIKGKDYKKKDITSNLNKEILALKKVKGKLIITNSKLLSSTKILNKIHISLSDKTENYLKDLNKTNTFDEIFKSAEKVKNMTINIIGEPILDKYVYCDMAGLTTKDPAMSTVIKKIKLIPGGVISFAKIISKFVKNVNLFTYGKKNEIKKFFKKYHNINIINIDGNQKIQTKIRYIDSNRFGKLLQVTNFRKNYLPKKKISKLIKIIKKLKDNIIICDFGLGLFEENIINALDKNKSKKYLNVQSNSINLGYNLFTKYNKYYYLCLDEREWKLGLGINENLNLLDLNKKNKNIMYSLTKGKRGSEFFSNYKKFESPVFINKTTDTTGCGDAYFAITSLMIKSGLRPKLIPFVGNIYAGIHSQYIGNEIITDKVNFLKYIKSILNR